MEYEASLEKTLSALGMGVAFSPGSADFSGMSPGPVYISRVKHKAVLQVDEGGTKAAAVTMVVANTTSMPNFIFDFVANRPFFFAIRDDGTGTFLFMGTVFEVSE